MRMYYNTFGCRCCLMQKRLKESSKILNQKSEATNLFCGIVIYSGQPKKHFLFLVGAIWCPRSPSVGRISEERS